MSRALNDLWSRSRRLLETLGAMDNDLLRFSGNFSHGLYRTHNQTKVNLNLFTNKL